MVKSQKRKINKRFQIGPKEQFQMLNICKKSKSQNLSNQPEKKSMQSLDFRNIN